MKKFHTSFLFFLSFLSLLLAAHNFPQVFLFYQLITINHDPHLRLIQTLHPHLSRPTDCIKPLSLIITSASTIFNKAYEWVCEWYIVSLSLRLHGFPRLGLRGSKMAICMISHLHDFVVPYGQLEFIICWRKHRSLQPPWSKQIFLPSGGLFTGAL